MSAQIGATATVGSEAHELNTALSAAAGTAGVVGNIAVLGTILYHSDLNFSSNVQRHFLHTRMQQDGKFITRDPDEIYFANTASHLSQIQGINQSSFEGIYKTFAEFDGNNIEIATSMWRTNAFIYQHSLYEHEQSIMGPFEGLKGYLDVTSDEKMQKQAKEDYDHNIGYVMKNGNLIIPTRHSYFDPAFFSEEEEDDQLKQRYGYIEVSEGGIWYATGHDFGDAGFLAPNGIMTKYKADDLGKPFEAPLPKELNEIRNQIFERVKIEIEAIAKGTVLFKSRTKSLQHQINRIKANQTKNGDNGYRGEWDTKYPSFQSFFNSFELESSWFHQDIDDLISDYGPIINYPDFITSIALTKTDEFMKFITQFTTKPEVATELSKMYKKDYSGLIILDGNGKVIGAIGRKKGEDYYDSYRFTERNGLVRVKKTGIFDLTQFSSMHFENRHTFDLKYYDKGQKA